MTSYADMLAQIDDLKKQAERVRKDELATVIRTIKKQIRDYGISLQDLGVLVDGSASQVGPVRGAKKRPLKARGKTVKAKKVVPAKYRDSKGNSWSGRGKTPLWVRDAIASGQPLETLLISQSPVDNS